MLTPDTILQHRYRIIRQLGQGGMGTVYEAIDQRFDSQVAIKETHFNEEALRKQFEREARLLNKLRHPAMTRVIDHFSENDGQFLVMDYVAGEELWELLQKQGGAFPVAKVLSWADQLLDALDYLHRQDPPIVHRDIKPQNLKLSDTDQIILLDFGLAKGFAGQISRVTNSGSIFGYTPNYAPLEQIQGTGTDARSDLYSLAATLYQLITGVTPPDALARAAANVNEQPDPLRPANEINSQVPSEVATIFQRALAQNPNKRFGTAAEMRAALRGAMPIAAPANGQQVTVLPPTFLVTPPETPEEQIESQPPPGITVPAQRLKEPDATIAAGTLAAPSPHSSDHSAPSQRSAFAAKPNTKSKRGPWIIGAILVLLLVGSAAAIIAIRHRTKTSGSRRAYRESVAAQLRKEGDSLYLQNKIAEAEAKYRQAIDLDPKNPEWHDALRGILLEAKGAEAVNEAIVLEGLAREALRSDPNNARLHTFLGGALRTQKKFEESEKELRQAVRLDPNYALAHQYLGLTFDNQKKLAEAEPEYREAVRLDPNDAWNQAHLADVFFYQAKPEEAEPSAREAIRLAPNYGWFHSLLGYVLYMQNKLAEAETETRTSISIEPAQAYYHSYLAEILQAEGKLNEAEEEFQEAVKLKPDESGFKDELQRLRAQKK